MTGCNHYSSSDDDIGVNNPNSVTFAEKSFYDNLPVVVIDDEEFYSNHQYVLPLTRELAKQGLDGKRKALLHTPDLYLPLPSIKVNSKLKSVSNSEFMSSHVRITSDETTEELILELQKLPNHVRLGKFANESRVFVALDPDKFIVDEDSNGDEIWPVTYYAYELGGQDSLLIEIGKDGLNSKTFPSDASLLFLTTIPIVENEGNDEVSSKVARGTETQSTSRYLVIEYLMLTHTGDGSGASELQLFTNRSDNYATAQFSKSYKARFDRVIRSDSPTPGNATTWAPGADGRWYETPDVNFDSVLYSFKQMPYDFKVNGNWQNPQSGYDDYPITGISTDPNDLVRVVLSDDDKRYQDFSRRRAGHWTGIMNTFDMSSRTWSNLTTTMNAYSYRTGSSDDPIPNSGVRRLSYQNIVSNGGNVERSQLLWAQFDTSVR